MDQISTYNSDIDVLNNTLNNTNKTLNELGDKNKIQNIKNYEDINTEVNNLLYRERIIFGISSIIAITITIATFKTI